MLLLTHRVKLPFPITGLCLGIKIYSLTDQLSTSLQSPDVSASKARELAADVCTVLQNLRSDKEFDNFLAEVNCHAESKGEAALSSLRHDM